MDGLEKNFNNRNIRMEIKAKFEGISPEKELFKVNMIK